MKAYEYRHIVSFEETNLVGNVYFANHIRWQGRVREMFLRDYAPDVINALGQGLSLVTTRVSCEYFQELFALDEVLIKMYATQITQNRVTMKFDYLRVRQENTEELIASGEQQIASMMKEGTTVRPTPLPQSLRLALYEFEI